LQSKKENDSPKRKKGVLELIEHDCQLKAIRKVEKELRDIKETERILHTVLSKE